MTYVLGSDVRFRRVLDEAVVIRQDAAQALGLNAVGARVFELARDGADEDEMVRHLADETNTEEVGLDQVRHDVRAFLAALVEAGVLEPLER